MGSEFGPRCSLVVPKELVSSVDSLIKKGKGEYKYVAAAQATPKGEANVAANVSISHTGPGKGKSSSGFGMIMRCIAHEIPCAVVQFIKGTWKTGERKFLKEKFSKECNFIVSGEGFTWETQDRAKDIAAAKAGWEEAKKLILNPDIQFVLLDEINIALRYDYLDIDEIVEFLLTKKPPMTHVVLTGRNAKEELIAAADLVTEMSLIKHPFRDGIKAQKGIEF